MGDFYRYLTQSRRDLKWGLVLTVAGYTKVPPQSTYPPLEHPAGYQFSIQHQRVLSEYQIIYIIQGSGTFESQHLGAKQIGPGTVFMLYPGEWHRYYPHDETGWTEYYLGFKGNYVDNLVKEGFIGVDQALVEIGFNDSMVNLFEEAFELVEHEHSGYQQNASGIVVNMLGKIVFHSKNRNIEDFTEQLIQKTKMLFRQAIRTDIDWQELCKKLGVSYSKFRKIFKNYVGMPPGQYFMQLKISKAKELLLQTNMPLKRMAEYLGFQDQYYFNSVFKQKTGISPGQFRKTHSMN